MPVKALPSIDQRGHPVWKFFSKIMSGVKNETCYVASELLHLALIPSRNEGIATEGQDWHLKHCLGSLTILFRVGQGGYSFQNNSNPRGNYGFSDFDTRNHFVFSGTWNLPFTATALSRAGCWPTSPNCRQVTR